MSIVFKNAMIGFAAFSSAWLTLADFSPTDETAESRVVATEVPYGTLERDRRLCAYPLCGGYLIRPVNSAEPSKFFHVNKLDFSKFGPEAEKLVESHLGGHVLIQGTLETFTDYSSQLKVTDVYTLQRGLSIVPTKATFIKSSKEYPPIVCVRAPCPNLLAEVLNTSKVVSFDRFDTSLLPFPVAEKMLLHPSTIVAGTFESGAAEFFASNYELIFSVSGLYRQVPAHPIPSDPAN